MKLKNYIAESNTKAAFFISPYGDIINTKGTHIDTVIKYPKNFGLTKEYIEDIYKKYNEKVGQEGKAREEIIKELMENGWIRIRRYPNKFWSVQIPVLSKKIKDYLYDWSKKIIKGFQGFKETDKFMPVRITSLKGNYSNTYTVDKISKDVLYNESEIRDKRNILTERKVEDLFDIVVYSLDESGYSRLMRIMSGLVPSVKTFAIFTWENPLNTKASKSFNKQAEKELKDTLKRGGFSYKQVKGRYGDYENPFIVFNISLDTAKNLAFEHEKYRQESVVYGERFVKNNNEGVVFRMFYYDNRPPKERKVWKGLGKSTEDMYTEYKGRKFYIPFFDDEFVGKILKRGKVVDEYNIFYSENYHDEIVNRINEAASKLFLDEHRSGHSQYLARGEMQVILNGRELNFKNSISVLDAMIKSARQENN